MRRVVVTGMGIVSSIGNNKEEVTEARCKAGRSGIVAAPEVCRNIGFPQPGAWIALNINDLAEHIDRKPLRFDGRWRSVYAYIAMQQAIDDAGLEPGDW